MRGLRIVAAFGPASRAVSPALDCVEITQKDGVVPRHRRAAIRTHCNWDLLIIELSTN